jgi:hypothetical protein
MKFEFIQAGLLPTSLLKKKTTSEEISRLYVINWIYLSNSIFVDIQLS